MPAVSMAGCVEQLEAIADPNADHFVRPFLGSPEADIADSVIKGEVKPALASLARFVKVSYLPICERVPIGCSQRNARGTRWYQACLNYHTSTNMTAEEVHAIGVTEVGRISDEMNAAAKACGFNSSAAMRDSLKSDPKNFWSSREAQLADYTSLCERINSMLGDYFGRLPKCQFEVVPIPDHEAPDSTTG